MSAYIPDRRDLRDPGATIAPRGPILPRAARFSRWDGSQSIPALDADEILDALADDVMAEGDMAAALRRLMERGWRSDDPSRRDLAGIQDLVERIQRRREELLDRFKLGDVLADVRRELDEIVAEERAGIERRLDRAAGAPPAADGRSATHDGSPQDASG
ncbi:MAG: hypothetical protein H0V87_05820, partial [Chloroflexi bacterium]|nr:hypothetical protein [Chloroflexota bacterium]